MAILATPRATLYDVYIITCALDRRPKHWRYATPLMPHMVNTKLRNCGYPTYGRILFVSITVRRL